MRTLLCDAVDNVIHDTDRKKIKIQTVSVNFYDNNHGKRYEKEFRADLVDMSDYSSENNGVRYLLTCIDLCSKYTCWLLFFFKMWKTLNCILKQGV